MAKTKKIVILEDDRILLKALNVELLSNDFEVFSASDGEAGLIISPKLLLISTLKIILSKVIIA